LTGAGGGGSIFALAPSGIEQRMADALRDTLQSAGVRNGRVFVSGVESHGLRVESAAR
jgi:mevalonate kinase